jgi:LysM repeat protein
MLVDDLFESRSNFGIGDPVIITGNVEFRGKTGDVRELGQDGSFVVVDLYNYGPQSFQASDVSRNDYADSQDEQDVTEVSKSTLDQYLTKASDAHGHADFAARMSKNDPDKRSYHVDQKKTAEKRRQGISRALDRMSNDARDSLKEHRMRITELNKRTRIDESLLLEDPVYRSFKQVGRYIAERRMSEKEILQVFADAEAGMTSTATGTNRTMLGRGKDKATDLAASIRDSLGKVLSSIQNSVPVSAVDTAYDQATDALAGLTGGQKSQVMQAIKKYRMLVKKYPKSSGFAKAALVAITGLATGGAGLPVIAGLTYALDAAIKGEKLSSVLGKGAGAAALAWAGQSIAGAVSGGDPAAAGTAGTDSAVAGADPVSNLVTPDKFPTADLPTYTVQSGDTLSQIARDNGISVKELIGLNPQLADATGATGGQSMNPDVIFPGQEITLPPESGAGTYDGGVGTSAGTQADIASGQIPDSAISQGPQINTQAISAAAPPPFGLDRVDALLNYQSQGFEHTASWNPETRSFDIYRASDWQQSGDSAIPVATDVVPPTPEGATDALLNQNQATADKIAQSMSGKAPGGGTAERFIPQTDGSWIDASTGKVADEAKLNLAREKILDFMEQVGIRNIDPRTTSFQESVQHKILPFEQLIDQKRTEMAWTLNESIGRKNNSFVLTTQGTYAVFENVERYRRAMMEVAGVPGSTRPALYRPDMPGATTAAPAAKKPGLLSRGLSRVGGALSTFGRQFTTNVTKEKLKMNWQQAGKPSDSDQLAAWLVKQGVPQDVVTPIYKKMGLPVTATSTQLAPQPTAQPVTQPVLSPATTAAPTAAKPTAAPTAAKPTATTSPASFNAGNVMNLPGMEKYAKPKTANFAGPSGYGQTTMGFKAPAAARSPAPAVAPAVPKPSQATAQGRAPTQAEKDAYVRSIGAPALPEANQEKVGNMDADKFDVAMARLKQLAGAGPLKTVYDPTKRVYRNVPTAVQPKK